MFDGQDSTGPKGAKQSYDIAKAFGRRQHQSIQIRSNRRDGALEKKRRQGTGDTLYTDPMNPKDETNPWSYDTNTPPVNVPMALIPTTVQMIKEGNPADQHQGVLLLRKMLAVERDAPIQAVVDTGIIPAIATLMNSENLQLQFDASWALSNIASGNAAHCEYIINQNVVPLWVEHLLSSSIDCQEQATWALGNIAGEGSRCRNYTLELGAMAPLLQLIASDVQSLSLLQSATWALSNLCRFKPLPDMKFVAPAVPTLVNLLQHNDLDIALDAAWALSYISDGPQERVQLIIDSGVVPTIVSMTEAQEPKFHMPAVRIIGNVCAGVDMQTQVAINCGALGPIRNLLDPARPRAIRKEAAWALSNVGAGTQDQIQALINNELIPYIVSTTGAFEMEVKKEAVWTLANIATNGNSDQINFLVECKTLEALSQVLASAVDIKILSVSLEAIGTILENGRELATLSGNSYNQFAKSFKDIDGDSVMDMLVGHSNEDIKTLAIDLLKTYFDYDFVDASTGNDVGDGLGGNGGAYGNAGTGGSNQDLSQYAGQFGDDSLMPQGGFNLQI